MTGPVPVKQCNKQTHLEDAARGLTLCTECRKPLFHRPPQKCARHSVWMCPECFSEEDLQELRGFTFCEQDEQENEDESEED